MTPHPDRKGEFVAPYGCIVTFEAGVLYMLCEKVQPGLVLAVRRQRFPGSHRKAPLPLMLLAQPKQLVLGPEHPWPGLLTSCSRGWPSPVSRAEGSKHERDVRRLGSGGQGPEYDQGDVLQLRGSSRGAGESEGVGEKLP